MVNPVPICDIHECTGLASVFDGRVGAYLCKYHEAEYQKLSPPTLLSQRNLAHTNSSNNGFSGWVENYVGMTGFEMSGYTSRNTGTLANAFTSLFSIGKPFYYGSYEQTIRLFPSALANRGYYPFAFELCHGFAGWGLIGFCLDGTTYKTITSYNGSTTPTTLTGQDWFSAARKLRIDWESDSVKFYVDGVLKSTHTTNIPIKPQNWFMEVFTGGTAPGAVDFGSVVNSFKRLK